MPHLKFETWNNAEEKRHPILSLSEFERQHEARTAALKRYMGSAWGRKIKDASAIAKPMMQRSAWSHYATNDAARIATAKCANKIFQPLIDDEDLKRDFSFVTITPQNMGFSLADIRSFDPDAFIATLQNQFRGYHYFGMIEAGYVSNFDKVRPLTPEMISFHAHMLMWNADHEKVDELRDRMNSEFRPLIPGTLYAHHRKLTPGRVVGRVMYLLKAPMSELRIMKCEEPGTDRLTGEYSREKFCTVAERAIRMGGAIKVCRALGTINIPELMFAGGEGEAIRKEIIDQSRADLLRERKAHLKHLRKLVIGTDLQIE